MGLHAAGTTAAAGIVLLVAQASAGAAWFSHLTDRAARAAGCPGGSTARVPFGVLTRTEQTFLTGSSASPRPGPGTTAWALILTTPPVLNHADPGLYGGCMQQSCQVRQLVWLTIGHRARSPGTLLACLPPSTSVPPGYRPKRVLEYLVITVPGNTEIDCGHPPTWLTQIKDLAPPGH